jgi:hypothetical protein
MSLLVHGARRYGYLLILTARVDALVLEEIHAGPAGIKTPPGSWLGDRLTIPRADIASIDIISRPSGGVVQQRPPRSSS